MTNGVGVLADSLLEMDLIDKTIFVLKRAPTWQAISVLMNCFAWWKHAWIRSGRS